MLQTSSFKLPRLSRWSSICARTHLSPPTAEAAITKINPHRWNEVDLYVNKNSPNAINAITTADNIFWKIMKLVDVQKLAISVLVYELESEKLIADLWLNPPPLLIANLQVSQVWKW